MDTLDVRILRALLQSGPATSLDLGFRRSFSAIARNLGVDEGTISHRVHRLRKSGFLKGWSVGINPELVGDKMIQLWVDVEPPTSKPEAIEKLRLLPGVAVVKDLYGPSLGLVVYYEGEASLERLTRLLSQITGSKRVESMPEPFPRCDTVLAEEDLRLIEALQKEPLTSFARLAHDLGRAAKTVRRRVDRLSRAQAIYLVAELDPKFLVGGIVGSLLVSYQPSADKVKVDALLLEQIADQLMFAELDAPHHSSFALALSGVAQSRDLLAGVVRIPGVATARLDLVAEVFSRYEVYAEQLARIRRSPHFRAARGRGTAASSSLAPSSRTLSGRPGGRGDPRGDRGKPPRTRRGSVRRTPNHAG